MISKTVHELIEGHVTLSIEGLDRIYINGYVPILQTEGGVAYYFAKRFNKKIASPVLMDPMTRQFVASVEKFIKDEQLDRVRFERRQRKDEITQSYLRKQPEKTGVLYVGVAQEKFSAFRMQKQLDKKTGNKRAHLFRSSVMCNQYYFYIVDEDWGPMFIKMASYFPYTLRICMNGHEYLKRQLEKEGITFEALDNGLLSCADPVRAQAIMDNITDEKIEAVIRKWLLRLPSPFNAEDREIGVDYHLSMLQAEFSLTQVFDKPLQGRRFFEEVIREHIDLGRPENVSLIFNRRVTKRTPTVNRTRIITQDVIPSLHVSYKYSKIKQYFKEGKALRTETVINNPRDFGIGKRLSNFSALREYGLETNRRLLNVQKLSQNCLAGTEIFGELVNPIKIENQRASGLRFGDDRAMVLLQMLAIFGLQVEGFTNRMAREKIVLLLGLSPDALSQGRISYDLRRLRLRNLILREPGTQRYRVTEKGLTLGLFVSKFYQRLINQSFSKVIDEAICQDKTTTLTLKKLDNAMNTMIDQIKFAA